MNKNRKFHFFLVLLILIPFLQVNTSKAAVQWGWPTHYLIVEESINYLDPEWEIIFDTMIALVKGGSILPDTWHDAGDTPNHLYYPDNPSLYTGPQAIERWYNYFVANMSNGNYEDGILSASIMSHYLSDLNIPVHTDDYWPGHSAYETDINSHISDLTLGTVVLDTNISDIQQYAIDAATNAHQYYDIVRDAYPDGNIPTDNPVMVNTTIKAFTEDLLTSAIGNVASLWIQGIGDALAPIVEITTTKKALIDNSHSNDYEKDGNLVNFVAYMNALGFNVVEDSDGITASDLADTDFLIVTAFETAFTVSELNAISSWISSGQRSIFVTGSSDYTSYQDIDHLAMNSLLGTMGTVIRLNDDGVLTVPSDPFYYQAHYVDVNGSSVQAPEGKTYLDDAQVFQFYRPCSLYFDSISAGLQILVNGSQYDWQDDNNPPVISVVWDSTNDAVGGEVIPLVAAEGLSLDDDRIIVFGDTSFSDYSFAPSSYHDNEHFMPVLIEWVLFDDITGGLSYLPRVEITTTETSGSSPVTIEYKVSTNAIEVALLVDGTEIETDSIKPFDSFTFSVSDGSHEIKIVAENTLGETSDDSLSISVTGGTGTTTVTTTTTTTTTTSATPWDTFIICLSLVTLAHLWQRKRKSKVKYD